MKPETYAEQLARRSAYEAADRSRLIHWVTVTTILAVLVAGFAFWVLFGLAIFGVSPWLWVLYPLGLAAVIAFLAFLIVAAVGLWHGISKRPTGRGSGGGWVN